MLSSTFEVSSSFNQIRGNLGHLVNVVPRNKRGVSSYNLGRRSSSQLMSRVHSSEDIHRLFLESVNTISTGSTNVS